MLASSLQFVGIFRVSTWLILFGLRRWPGAVRVLVGPARAARGTGLQLRRLFLLRSPWAPGLRLLEDKSMPAACLTPGLFQTPIQRGRQC